MDTQRNEKSPRPVEQLSRPAKKRTRPEVAKRPQPLPVVPVRHGWYGPAKRTAEFVIALLLGVLTAPLMVLAALLVKLTSRGPAFYTQARVGRNGRPFTIYKVRTMIHNAESLTGPRWAVPGDPRITWVGHLLRISHLDELPQLFNVLR